MKTQKPNDELSRVLALLFLGWMLIRMVMRLGGAAAGM